MSEFDWVKEQTAYIDGIVIRINEILNSSSSINTYDDMLKCIDNLQKGNKRLLRDCDEHNLKTHSVQRSYDNNERYRSVILMIKENNNNDE
jgi:phosphopantothenate synthetase